jgi:hypothetical protein
METYTFSFPKSIEDKVRAISLAAFLLKVMEKLITVRLAWWLEYNHPYISAFVRTNHAWIRLPCFM